MKKISTTIFAMLLTLMVFAQTRTLQSVSYRGAFEPDVPMWTAGWTNFDPNTTNYDSIHSGKTVTTVTAAITRNTTWLSSRVYVISGPIYVKSGVTLTIQPGTLIKGNALASNSCLIVSRGGKINAQGTSSNPIVFTSSKGVGQKNLGDWGGIILLGKAKINAIGGVANIEGLAAAVDNEYGGTDDEDNSGVFSYCRIEFGGYIFSPDKEINGLTMGGVGRKTKIDHIQTSFINDDAFEWFGGTVNCTHLVSYRNLDDDMDTDFGYSGTVQFGLVIRDKNYFDPSSGSTSEGFESDGEGVGSDSTIVPRTKAIFSNITLIGPGRNDVVGSVNAKFQRCIRIRRNSNLRIFNSVFTDFPNGLHFDGDRCAEGARTTNNPDWNSTTVRYNVFASIKGTMMVANSRFSAIGISSKEALFSALGNDSSYKASSNGLFVDNVTASNFEMDYRPATGSPLASGANFSDDFITSRTRLGLGSVDITVDSIEIASLSEVQTATLTVGSIANADVYTWRVPTGCTIVSGQGTTSITVSFLTNLATSIAKPKFIYCSATNIASGTFSTTDSVRIAKTKPTFLITGLLSNANNNLIGKVWNSNLTSSAAASQKVVNVTSTSGLKAGMLIKLVAGTGAGAVGTSNRVATVNSATQFTLVNNITTTIVTGAELYAYVVPQNAFAAVTLSAASSISTLVTVTSTVGLKEGMWLTISSGIGTFKKGTVVAKIVDSFNFVLSLPPTLDLSGATILAYPLLTNTCPVAVATGFTSEFDVTAVATPSNNIGYRFDAPKGARICRVGSNTLNDYTTNRTAFVLTTANNVGIVFDSSYVSGAVKVTPYNNAGSGKAFSVTVKKEKAGIFKVISNAAALPNTTVNYKASVTNGSEVAEYKWTIPTTGRVSFTHGSAAGTVSGFTIITITDTLSLSFNGVFTSGSLKVEALNNCGTGTGKSFVLNGTTTLTKKQNSFELEENTTDAINSTFNVYPNPSNGSFTVSMLTENKEDAAEIVIYNTLGQIVRTISAENNNGIINADINSQLENGIYIVKVKVGSEMNTIKISVE